MNRAIQPKAGLTPWQPADDWTQLKGLDVEVHVKGMIVDYGHVEVVTDDGRILWLRQEGLKQRRLIEKRSELHIQICP